MAWDVEYTNEFEDWWNDLTIDEQDAAEACIPFLCAMDQLLVVPW